MTKARELLDAWATRKVEDLQYIVDMLNDYFLSNKYVVKECPKIDWSKFKEEHNIHIDMDETAEARVERLRKQAVQRFKVTGDVFYICTYPRTDYENCIDEGSKFWCISEDCKALIEILEHRRKAHDMIMFIYNMEVLIHAVIEAMAYAAGIHDMKYKQAEKRLGCGKGQQEAQARRILMLVESLKEYDISKDELRIKKNTFRGLVNKTFIDSENYSRHHSVYKTYQIESEKILSKKIIIT